MPSTSSTTLPVEADEEDEEEDDDDGDLSKYDLSGWGDSNENTDEKTLSEEKKSESRSKTNKYNEFLSKGFATLIDSTAYEKF